MSEMAQEVEHITPQDPVSRIMTSSIIAVEADESVLSVAQELAADEIGVVLVASPGIAVGLISERDIVTIVGTGGDLSSMQAGDVMTSDLIVAHPEDSIASVGRLMLDSGIRHVPIRTKNHVMGLVSMRDVLAVLL